jgi:hypothetical protein
MDDYKEFLKKIKKVSSTRKYTVRNSYGIADYYKYYKNSEYYTNTPLSLKEYSKILKAINNSLKESLLSCKDIVLPYYMGNIELRKFDTYVKLDNNKLRSNRGVDWSKTLKLWYNDNKAKINKTLVKNEAKVIYRIYYNKNKAKYINKMYYEFIPNRVMKIQLKERIDQGLIDAYNI